MTRRLVITESIPRSFLVLPLKHLPVEAHFDGDHRGCTFTP
jgi:hypothetical protein